MKLFYTISLLLIMFFQIVMPNLASAQHPKKETRKIPFRYQPTIFSTNQLSHNPFALESLSEQTPDNTKLSKEQIRDLHRLKRNEREAAFLYHKKSFDKKQHRESYRLSPEKMRMNTEQEDFASSFVTGNVQDSLVLVTLFDSTGGPNWRYKNNWKTGNLSTWQGVGLNDSGRVVSLYFYFNNMVGKLPQSISNLKKLNSLTLAYNYGLNQRDFPVGFGSLDSLRFLNLAYDTSSSNGHISNELLRLRKLRTFQFWGMKLSNESFENLCDSLNQLTYLYLFDNQLTDIPSSLSNLTQLQNLIISFSDLSNADFGNLSSLTSLTNLRLNYVGLKSFPQLTSSLTSLSSLDLSGNQISGSLPSFVGLNNLTELYLDYNQFSGTIPTSYFSLPNLRSLSLSGNQLTGSIPTFSSQADFSTLDLSYNSLSGEIPSSISTQINLSYLYLSGNELSGAIPNLAALQSLYSLDLSSNQLSGSIPNSIGTLSNLNYLYLSYNQFNGSIPNLSGLTNLYYLYLNDNELSGTIPGSVFQQNLESIDLSYNYSLTGTLPSQIQNSPNLYYLYAQSDSLTGSLPSFSQNLSLQYLDLSYNYYDWSASVPTSLFTIPNIYYLALNGCKISGTLNSGFANLSTLNTLSLSDNNITSFPSQFNTTNIVSIYLQRNQLTDSTGAVGLGNLTSAQTIYLSNNYLKGSVFSELRSITNLSFLDMTSNLISDIDTSIGSLSQLRTLGLSYNQIQRLPSQLGNLSNLQGLYLFSNNLRDTINISSNTSLVYTDLRFNNLSAVQVAQIPYSGTILVDNGVSIFAVVSSTNENDQRPVGFSLLQNYPNPFNPSTQISYQLATNSDVRLEVFDILGRKVQTLVNRNQQQGSYSVTLNAQGLASGLYFYRLEATSRNANFVRTKKMLLIK